MKKLYIHSNINENQKVSYPIDNIKDIIFFKEDNTQYFQIIFKDNETATFETSEWYISFEN